MDKILQEYLKIINILWPFILQMINEQKNQKKQMNIKLFLGIIVLLWKKNEKENPENYRPKIGRAHV